AAAVRGAGGDDHDGGGRSAARLDALTKFTRAVGAHHRRGIAQPLPCDPDRRTGTDHVAAHPNGKGGGDTVVHGRTAGAGTFHGDPAGAVRARRAATPVRPRAVVGPRAVFRIPPRL